MSTLFLWSPDTSVPFIELANEDAYLEINKKYKVEQGNYIFKINCDFENSPIFIAAKRITCKIPAK